MDGLLTAEEFPAEFDENRDDGKLYAEYRRLAAEQAALRRVATLVARGVGPLEVFGAVAVEMRRCVSAVTAGLWRFETDGEITIAAAAADSAALARWPVGTRTPLEGNTLAALVQRSGWLARIDSYDNVAGSFAARVRAVDVRSAVGVRIIVDGRVWGLAVGSVQPGPMPADTEVHIGRFAELIATAVVAGYRDEQKRQLLAEARLAEERASALRHLDVGNQHAYPSGGQPRHCLEERTRFRRGHCRNGGIVVRVIKVEHAISRGRSAVLFWPHLRRLEAEVARDSPGCLQLL